jgi:glutathione S-transferase
MVILHHYPQSPVSEKVRVVLGLKGLDWRSVEIPRLPPKPDLMPLTGGYRLTPVMQVGADIYCDSQCIIRELERRFPEPTLFPEGASGMAWGLSRWTDGPLFRTAVALVFGAGAADLPPEFAADRGLLYFGTGFDLAALTEALPGTLAQLRAQLGWLEDCLTDSRKFLAGSRPGLADALGYYLVWFIRGRYAKGPEFLEPFERLCAWESRVKDVGHGNMSAMDAGEALDAARDAQPESAEKVDSSDPQNLKPGDEVAVMPDSVDGAPPVSGCVHALTPQEIVIRRTDGRVGDVAVHFPRVGYCIQQV